MAKTKKTKESVMPSEELVLQAIQEGQALIAEGKTKVDAAMAIYRNLHEAPQEIVIQAFVEGAFLTPKGAMTYWYNCRRKFVQAQKS